MKFFAVATFIAAATAAAVPASKTWGDDGYGDDGNGDVDYNACPNFLYSNPVCGAVDVLSLACLDVKNVPEQPESADHFRELCARTGGKALCATLPILGQGLLCKSAIGADRK